jgi:hypothetical protein
MCCVDDSQGLVFMTVIKTNTEHTSHHEHGLRLALAGDSLDGERLEHHAEVVLRRADDKQLRSKAAAALLRERVQVLRHCREHDADLEEGAACMASAFELACVSMRTIVRESSAWMGSWQLTCQRVPSLPYDAMHDAM